MRAPLFIVFSALTAIACSSTTTGTSSGSGTSGGGGSSGSTPVSQADCSSACQTKATTCGAAEGQATDLCASICSSATQGQLDCLQSKPCAQLQGNLATLCPKEDTGSSSGSSGSSGTPSTKKKLGDACLCAGRDSASEGLCAGTSEECASGLSCIFQTGSSGKGSCYGASCCDDTSKCDDDKSLLTSCSAGTCRRTDLGWYCAK